MSPKMSLDRPTMITAALKVLDEVGLDGLTLRRLATALNVQAPAIYWHFKHKQDLLDEMASTALVTGIRQIRLAPTMKWDKWAMSYGKGLRQILLLHRDGARMISGTRLTDTSLYEPMEQSLRVLVNAGLPHQAAVTALSTIYCYVVGFVIEEQAVHPMPGERNDLYDMEKRSQRIDPNKLPLASNAGEYLFSNFDRRFKNGLNLIVSGLATQIKPAQSKR
jgi:TetR/AcrR family tetracycline transcriptional repressor